MSSLTRRAFLFDAPSTSPAPAGMPSSAGDASTKTGATTASDDTAPAHAGPHPDDPSLPAVDELTVLLTRTGFGARESEYRAARESGYEAWLEFQLQADPTLDAALEAEIAASLPRVGMTEGELLADAAATGNQARAAEELRAATLLRHLYSRRQLYQVMVDFWSDHFNIQNLAFPERLFKNVDDREVIRTHALGRFGDLLKASARSTAMLFYLDNQSNVVSGPNENYARELMELHTLGIDGGYTEQDIQEVARCFTGWTVTGLRPGGNPRFAFVPSRHDFGSKVVLGQPLPPGFGIEDGERVLDLLIAHPSTAAFIARKLCIRFIADDPQPSIVDAVAATYRDTGGDIRAMLRTLLRSQEFRTAYDRKFKRPLDFVVSALRTTEATLSGNFLRILASQLATMGQVPFFWPTPDGYPDDASRWISTNAMLARWNFALALGEGAMGAGVAVDIESLAGDATTPTTAVDALAARLLRRPLSAADRKQLIDFSRNGAPADQAYPAAWRKLRLRELVALLLSSPYFQYR